MPDALPTGPCGDVCALNEFPRADFPGAIAWAFDTAQEPDAAPPSMMVKHAASLCRFAILRGDCRAPEAREYVIAQLGEQIRTLSPVRLAEHPKLGIVYTAARQIVAASYDGRLRTPSIEGDFPDDYAPLVQHVLERFDDGRGYVRFPLVARHAIHDFMDASSGDTGEYTLRRRPVEASGQEDVHFSSVPG